MLVCLDIDGTLTSAGGPVDGDIIQDKLERSGVTWGVLSSRSVKRAREACVALGVEPQFIYTCRVDMRAEELMATKELHPNHERYVYVADREADRQEALRSGWEFCWANKFQEIDI